MSEEESLNPNYLTVKEVSELLRISTRTVYEWIRSGRLYAVKAGPKEWRIPREHLDVFLRTDHRPREKADAAPPEPREAASEKPGRKKRQRRH